MPENNHGGYLQSIQTCSLTISNNTTYAFKGELNLDNKWKSDDLFYI